MGELIPKTYKGKAFGILTLDFPNTQPASDDKQESAQLFLGTADIVALSNAKVSAEITKLSAIDLEVKPALSVEKLKEHLNALCVPVDGLSKAQLKESFESQVQTAKAISTAFPA